MSESKIVLRQRILKLLRSQKEDDRLKKSRAIELKLFKTPEFKKARVILFYASFDGEVETFAMMKQALQSGKKIVLPRILRDQKSMILSFVTNLKKDLTPGPYGILHPKKNALRPLYAAELDLAIVPGVAFDCRHNRLGRGAGYYDRFLAQLPKTIPVLGLAFDFQIVSRLPHLDAHDIPVSRVIAN